MACFNDDIKSLGTLCYCDVNYFVNHTKIKRFLDSVSSPCRSVGYTYLCRGASPIGEFLDTEGEDCSDWRTSFSFISFPINANR